MRFIFCLIILQLSTSLLGQSIIYVNHQIQGGQQNGSSWANSYADLQEAITVSQEGDSIWVAKGIYYPTNGIDRSISFVLKQGVKLFGGFSGTESTLMERNISLNETILSGNIGQPTQNDNSYHVLIVQGVDSSTVLDGFIIKHGNANNGPDDNDTRGGGAIVLPAPNLANTCPIIQNCRFEFNLASVGGGMAIIRNFTFENYVSPIIRNCHFINNRAGLNGGGIAKIGPSLPSEPFLLAHCIFKGNKCGIDGGGIFFNQIEYETVLQHCTFEKDTSNASAGGGVYFASGYEESAGAVLTLENCHFSENVAAEGGGFYYVDNGSGFSWSPAFKADLNYCYFEKNKANNGFGGAIQFSGGIHSKLDITIKNTNISDNLSKSGYGTLIQAEANSISNIIISTCKFIGNRTLDNPDLFSPAIGLHAGGSEAALNATIHNSLFFNNGAGIQSTCSMNAKGIKTIISNATFFNNHNDLDLLFYKSYFPTFNGIDHYSDLIIKNSIIWEPGISIWNMFSETNDAVLKLDGYAIDHCFVSLDSIIISTESIFGPGNLAEIDPGFANSANNDFSLHPCSPLLNVGDNAIVDSLGLYFDLAGNPRIHFGQVDLGAYETQFACVSDNMETPLARYKPNLWPNPAISMQIVQLELPQLGYKNITWTLFDTRGNICRAGETQTSETGTFSLSAPAEPGGYFIVLNTDMEVFQTRLVVLP